MRSMDGVPSILHFTAPDTLNLTELVHGRSHDAVWSVSFRGWLSHFPPRNFSYRIWGDVAAAEFARHHCPESSRLLRQLAIEPNVHPVVGSDVLRPCLLSTIGGIYADLDYEPRANFFASLQPGHASLLGSPYSLAGARSPERVQNALMASPAGHPYWRAVLDKLGRARLPRDIGALLFTTGPGLYASLRATFNTSLVAILPAHHFHRATHTPRGGAAAPLLKPQDAADPTLLGVHWGTFTYSDFGRTGAVRGSGQFKRLRNLFEAFHPSTRASKTFISSSNSSSMGRHASSTVTCALRRRGEVASSVLDERQLHRSVWCGRTRSWCAARQR
jgi:hypothetical protein